MLNQRFLGYILIGALAISLAACSSTPTRQSPQWIGYSESGEASFYAMKYQFRRTASGERFNQFSRTAAHKELPFGSLVKVTNVANGASVVVRINDRGPFVAGRIIDLSRSAFSDIADLDSGVIEVEIQVVSRERL